MQEKLIMFRNRLAKVYRHLGKQAGRRGVSCFRIYDHDLPEFPLSIDKYEDKLHIAEYRRQHKMTEHEHNVWLQNSLQAAHEVLEIPKENIYTSLRQRKPGRLGQYRKSDSAGDEFIVKENKLSFIIRLGQYLDTGLFLDHRITREMVKEMSTDKKVLNLFCYTGSFTVYAASGNAEKITSVDLSNTYLTWARKNLLLNGFEADGNYEFIQRDVISFLPQIDSGSYDLIILDPPTFSNSKRMDGILDVQKDHVFLINECLRVLSGKGLLIFSTNYRKFRLDVPNMNSESIKDITKATTPFDFEGRLHRACFQITKQ